MIPDRRAYMRRYQNAWAQTRRLEAIASMGGACVRCDSTENLEVDHIDPATKVSHRIWGWSTERRRAELAKCQLLCRPCHHKKTGAEKRRPITHGTPSGSGSSRRTGSASGTQPMRRGAGGLANHQIAATTASASVNSVM